MQMRKVDMAAKKILHEYHSAFYKIFKIPLDWVGEDNSTFTICGQGHCNPLCERIMASAAGKTLCDRLTVSRIQTCRHSKNTLISSCHAGFIDAMVPIFVEDNYIGSLCLGQFLSEVPSGGKIAEIRKGLNALNISEEELKNYYSNTPVISPERLDGLITLLQMLGGYICESQMKLNFLQSIHQSDPIGASMQYIELRYKSPLTVKKIGLQVGLSESYFTHLFSKQTGMSPINYLNSYRIKKAIQLLEETELNIAEIAFSVGFQSLQHFNRMFKKFTKKSPKCFRS